MGLRGEPGLPGDRGEAGIPGERGERGPTGHAAARQGLGARRSLRGRCRRRMTAAPIRRERHGGASRGSADWVCVARAGVDGRSPRCAVCSIRDGILSACSTSSHSTAAASSPSRTIPGRVPVPAGSCSSAKASAATRASAAAENAASAGCPAYRRRPSSTGRSTARTSRAMPILSDGREGQVAAAAFAVRTIPDRGALMADVTQKISGGSDQPFADLARRVQDRYRSARRSCATDAQLEWLIDAQSQ